MKKQFIFMGLLICVTSKIFGQLKVGVNPTTITTDVNFESEASNASKFVILRSTGRVGVGTTSPTEMMDISGNLKVTGAFMPGNSAGTAGQILVSGGAGAAPTWLTMSATNTPNIYSADGTLAGNRVVTQGANTLRFDGTASTGGSALFSNGTGSSLVLAAKSSTGKAALQATAGSTTLNYSVDGGAAAQITSTGATSFDIGNTNAVNMNFLTNNATRMTISSTGNVGIGTTTPGNLLNVYNNTNASIGDNFPMVNVFSNNTSNNSISVGSGLSGATIVGIHGSAGVGELLQNSRYLGSPAMGANIQLMTGITTASPKALLTATSDGKIGIGTITPTYSLHVLNSTQNTRELLEVSDSTYINSLDLKSPTSQWRIIQQAYSNGNRLDFYDQKNTKNVLTLQPVTGHVGINRTNPLGQIHFGSKGSFGANQFYSGATLDGFMIDTYINISGQNGNTYTRVADFAIGSTKTTTAGASMFRFLTNTNADAGDTLIERMRIHTNGFIGIGTSSPGHPLHIDTSTPTALYLNSSNTDVNGLIQLNVPSTNSTGNLNSTEYINFYKAGTYIGKIGMTTAGTGIEMVSVSDKRLKQNIRMTDYGLSDLMKINVADYQFIADNNKVRQTGFLAQQLYDIYPQAVRVGKNDELDSDGLPKNPWMVDYSKLTPLLVKATQDLKKELDEKQLLIDKQQVLINQLIKDVEELKNRK